MVLIDTHTHLYLPHFADDIEHVVKNALDRHVIKLLMPNIDCDSVGPMLSLCRKFPDNCYPMLGLHPASVANDYRDKLSFLETFFETEKFVAIGETGMDAYWDTSFINQQEDSFIKHIEWAKKMDLPLVIHSRDTMDNILTILKSHTDDRLKGVFHAFSGSLEQALLIVKMGFKLGIGGVVTYKNSKLDPIINAIDIEHLLLETDSPYLTPMPKRGQRNESANLHYIARKISELKDLSIEQVAKVTSNNAAKLFNLKIE